MVWKVLLFRHLFWQHEACVHGHVTAASVLLEHGALVNVPGHGNDTPLHDAVGNNHCSVAALLLKHGASCNIRNRSGLTALDLARTAEMKQILITPPHLHTTPPPDNSGVSPCCSMWSACFTVIWFNFRGKIFHATKICCAEISIHTKTEQGKLTQ